MVFSSLFFKEISNISKYVCLRVLKESNKSRFDSYSFRNSVLIISYITFRDCRVHSFSDNLSRNSCILNCRHYFFAFVCVLCRHRRGSPLITLFIFISCFMHPLRTAIEITLYSAVPPQCSCFCVGSRWDLFISLYS